MNFEIKNCRKCGANLDRQLFACRDHWMELPEELREGIRDTYVKEDYDEYRKLAYRANQFWKRGDLPA